MAADPALQMERIVNALQKFVAMLMKDPAALPEFSSVQVQHALGNMLCVTG